jgi:uncharacterized protein YkwD/uncharacterized membrane protein required for colicin V production
VNWLFDLFVLAILGFAAYAGFKRGAIYMGLELLSFLFATVVALFVYHPLGSQARELFNISSALANVAGFTVAWVISELAFAIAARFFITRHINRAAQLSRLNRIAGGVLGVMRTAVILALTTIVITGLPLGKSTRNAITGSISGNVFLSSTGSLNWLASGLGRDLGESLNFFTVTADPESTERIDLGYKTTGPVDPKEEDALLALLNKERTSRGLQPLSMNEDARKVARDHSKDMFENGYFSHISLDGKSPFDRMRAGGVEFGTAGENLALAPTVPLAHQGLMNSPGHRANILNPKYRTVGIGIIDGGPYGLMSTQDFTD